MVKKVECPKCGHEFQVMCNDKEESIKLLLDENQQFLADATSKDTKEWNEEAKKERERILDLIQRINNLYK